MSSAEGPVKPIFLDPSEKLTEDKKKIIQAAYEHVRPYLKLDQVKVKIEKKQGFIHVAFVNPDPAQPAARGDDYVYLVILKEKDLVLFKVWGPR